MPAPPPDDGIDQDVLAVEVDRLIAACRPDPGIGVAAIRADLAQLEELRRDHRTLCRVTTALWIVVTGLVAWSWFTGWPLPLLPAVALGVFTWQLMVAQDVSRARGRELDADIAYARGRLGKGRGENS